MQSTPALEAVMDIGNDDNEEEEEEPEEKKTIKLQRKPVVMEPEQETAKMEIEEGTVVVGICMYMYIQYTGNCSYGNVVIYLIAKINRVSHSVYLSCL